MRGNTVENIQDSIIQIQELADLFKKNLESRHDLAIYVAGIFFDCKEESYQKLEEKKQYLQEEISYSKPGKNKWKTFSEALEGLECLIDFSRDPVKKHILKRPLEEAIEGSRAKVRKIQTELGKTDDASLPETPSLDKGR